MLLSHAQIWIPYQLEQLSLKKWIVIPLPLMTGRKIILRECSTLSTMISHSGIVGRSYTSSLEVQKKSKNRWILLLSSSRNANLFPVLNRHLAEFTSAGKAHFFLCINRRNVFYRIKAESTSIPCCWTNRPVTMSSTATNLTSSKLDYVYLSRRRYIIYFALSQIRCRNGPIVTVLQLS